MAGVLFAYAQHNVIPDSYQVLFSIIIFLAVVIGGITSIPFAVVGAVVLEAFVLFGHRLDPIDQLNRGPLVWDRQVAAAETKTAVEHQGVIDPTPGNPIVVIAWTVLDAANDVDDVPTMEACLRVIDASFSGALPARSDVHIIFDFFN